MEAVDRRPLLRYGVGAALLFLGVAATAAIRGLSVPSNDGAQYLSVARHVAAGDGVVTSIVYYEEHYGIGTVPVAQTVFPPGYPAAVAGIQLLGVPPRSAALFVCFVSFLSTAVVITLLALRLGIAAPGSLFLGCVWLCFVPAWFNLVRLNSEMLFILLTVACLYALALRVSGSRLPLVAAGAAAAGAFCVRYAGIFLIMSLALWFGSRLLHRRDRASLGDLVAVASPPALAVCILFGRNWLLVGDLKGGNAEDKARSAARVFRELYYSISDISGFSWDGLTRLGLPEVAAALLAAGTLVWLALRRERIDVDVSLLRELPSRPALGVAALYVLITFALVTYLEATTSLGLQGRMLQPLVPFCLIILPWLARCLRVPGDGTAIRRWTWMVVGVYLLGQGAAFGRARERYEEGRATESLIRGELDRLRQEQPGLWDAIHAGPPVLGNQPQLLGESLGIPVVGLTQPAFTSRTWSSEEVQGLTRHYGIEYVLLFPTLLARDPSQPDSHALADLKEGRPVGWLNRVYGESDLHVYRVDPNPAATPSETPR